MSIESAFKSAGLDFTYGEELKEQSCLKCNCLLEKFSGQAEIKLIELENIKNEKS